MTVLSVIGRPLFDLAHTVSPILLKNGLAEQLPEKLLPLTAFTQMGLLPITSDGFFAKFKVLPGGTLMQNTVATYPVANQATAGNAFVMQPSNVSILMYCPANATYNVSLRKVLIMATMDSIKKHLQLGGLFVIITPLGIYDNCCLTGIRDTSEGENATNGLQNALTFDFVKPQIMDEDDSKSYMSSFMTKIADKVKI